VYVCVYVFKLSKGLVLRKLMGAWNPFSAFICHIEMGVGRATIEEGKAGGAEVHWESLAET